MADEQSTSYLKLTYFFPRYIYFCEKINSGFLLGSLAILQAPRTVLWPWGESRDKVTKGKTKSRSHHISGAQRLTSFPFCYHCLLFQQGLSSLVTFLKELRSAIKNLYDIVSSLYYSPSSPLPSCASNKWEASILYHCLLISFHSLFFP